MRFTEHELTAALTGAAKSVLAAQRKDIRKGTVDVDTAWEAMTRYERFQLLDALGGQVLPALVALPEVDVATGSRPSYTDAQVSEVVTEQMTDSGAGRLKRAVLVKARTALVQIALANVPPRLDPDALIQDLD